MSSERIVWTQEVHLICPREIVETLASSYVQEFKDKKNVQVTRWGYTCKEKQGYIILEWDGEADEVFLDRLEQSKEIQDFYLHGVCYDLVQPETPDTSQHTAEASPVGG